MILLHITKTIFCVENMISTFNDIPTIFKHKKDEILLFIFKPNKLMFNHFLITATENKMYDKYSKTF